jgi:hypothetical protein
MAKVLSMLPSLRQLQLLLPSSYVEGGKVVCIHLPPHVQMTECPNDRNDQIHCVTQVREMRLPHTEATGPCKARALAAALWDGEEYVLQVDAHMR